MMDICVNTKNVIALCKTQEKPFGKVKHLKFKNVYKHTVSNLEKGVDVNALNLYGETALSTATCYNQILCVEYLLANKADPKLQLSAGHTAVHIACRSANVPILHMLLSVKKDDSTEEEHQEKADKHVHDCLQIKDHANLTPIHWAATHESVSKRQKMFAYLDKRMPGVLDSRYNMNWFISWAKTHPWVMKEKSTKNIPSVSSVRCFPNLTNTDKTYRQYYEQGASLPLSGIVPVDMTSRASLKDAERTTRPTSITTTTNGYYDNVGERNKRISSQTLQATSLPPTPITSRIVTFKHPILKHERQELPCTQKSSLAKNNLSVTSQKTPYSQRLSSIVQHFSSPLSDRSTYRAERAHVIPTFHFPPSPPPVENKPTKEHDYEDMITPITSKRPSHNLLSNIIPSTSTSSSDPSSRQSTKLFASFGFDASIDRGNNNNDVESFYEDENHDYESNHFDYLCNSASTLGLSSSGGYTSDV